jgi:hypothetical protein
MLREGLEGSPWFDGDDWNAVCGLPVGVRRKP